MDWDGLNDLGDGSEQGDEVTARAGMGRTKKCFESDRIVWKCFNEAMPEWHAEGCPEERIVSNEGKKRR